MHLILLECLVEESTALSCEGDLEARVAQLRSRGNVQRQFQRLEKQTKVREPQGIDLTILEQVKHKNRLNNVVPGMKLVYLYVYLFVYLPTVPLSHHQQTTLHVMPSITYVFIFQKQN